jgi:tetrahydromethanopterin S-methyltransferase subunit G
MFFGKKSEDISLEDRLKEIEQKVKGLEKKEQQVSQQPQPSLNVPQQQNIEIEKPVEKTKEEKVEEETQVPLFVKLDKYKTIVSSLMQLKALLISLKNSLIALEQIEKTRVETFNVIMKNLDKMNEKLSLLEKEVVKPVGFSFGMPAAPYAPIEEMQSVQASIASLKAQIDQLKAELESVE